MNKVCLNQTELKYFFKVMDNLVVLMSTLTLMTCAEVILTPHLRKDYIQGVMNLSSHF